MTPADLARQNAISFECKKDALQQRQSASEKFEALISPEPNTGCWIWVGCIHNKFGYGRFQFEKVRDLAHRTSWTIYKGEIPAGQSVLHKCDCAYCVNPEHLFLGTLLDNTMDMCAKGRQRGAVGTANGNAKLTPAEVVEIRDSSKPVKELVAEYAIKKSMIYYIRAGQYWKGA